MVFELANEAPFFRSWLFLIELLPHLWVGCVQVLTRLVRWLASNGPLSDNATNAIPIRVPKRGSYVKLVNKIRIYLNRYSKMSKNQYQKIIILGAWISYRFTHSPIPRSFRSALDIILSDQCLSNVTLHDFFPGWQSGINWPQGNFMLQYFDSWQLNTKVFILFPMLICHIAL